MDIRAYEYPLVIAREGSLSGAAAVLGITQSALSHNLASLEAKLGKPIFDRSTRYLKPTAAGSAYLELAEQIVAVKKQTYHAIRSLSQSHDQTITIGVSPVNGAMFFAYLYQHFQPLFPKIKLVSREAYPSDIKPDLLSGAVDIIVGTNLDNTEDGFRFLRFARQEIVAAVSAGHPLASQAAASGEMPTSITLKELEDTPFLLPDNDHTAGKALSLDLSGQQIQSTVLIRSNNMYLLKEMTQLGLGVGFLSSTYVYRNPLLRYFTLNPPVYMYSGMYYSSSRHLDLPLKVLAALCYRYTIQRTDNPHLVLDPCDATLAILEDCRKAGVWN